MGADGGLAQAEILEAGGFEGVGEGGARPGAVEGVEFFASGADGGVGELGEGEECGEQLGAGEGDLATVGEEEGVEGGDFAPAGGGGFQQEVAGAQGAVVVAEGASVVGADLGGEEVEETAALFGAPADDFDVGIGEPDDAFGEEVVGRGGLFDGVEGEFFALGAEVELEVFAAGVAVDEETACAVLDDFSEARGAWGLESEEDANGLEEGGFAVGVGAEDEVEPGLEGGFEVFEAAEVAQFDVLEHERLGGVLGEGRPVAGGGEGFFAEGALGAPGEQEQEDGSEEPLLGAEDAVLEFGEVVAEGVAEGGEEGGPGKEAGGVGEPEAGVGEFLESPKDEAGVAGAVEGSAEGEFPEADLGGEAFDFGPHFLVSAFGADPFGAVVDEPEDDEVVEQCACAGGGEAGGEVEVAGVGEGADDEENEVGFHAGPDEDGEETVGFEQIQKLVHGVEG
ncbi:MAG: hypothetical protein RLZZ244_2278 [Verrucomicrobiota bacterium]